MEMNDYNNLVVFMQPVMNAAITQITNQNNIAQVNSITSEIKDFYISGYNPSNVVYMTPPGYFSVPLDNSNAIIMNVAGGNKTQVVMGTIPTIPLNNPMVTDGIQKGECGLQSINWGLADKNDGIKAYKFDNSLYRATLNSGEWLSKFILDLINDNNVTLRNYINNQINLYLSTHTHSGVTTGTGNSGTAIQPVVNITQNTALNDDVTYINNQNHLLNNNAIVVP